MGSGTLDVTTIAFGEGDGEIDFNISDADVYTFASAVTGTGDINVYNGAISLTGDYSAYDGATTVYGGTLLVDTDTFLTSAISVADGGTLGGTGTVTDVTLSSGSTIAPGDDGIGTLTVSSGNVTFVSGSSLAVELDSDGTSDLLNVVGGSATIDDGATLHVSAVSTWDGSSYSYNSGYTVLTASGGVDGTFTTVTDDFAYLDAEVSYDDDNVYVALERNSESFASAVSSNNKNGQSVANAISSLGEGNDLYDAIVWLTDDGVDKTYQELSGDTYAGTTSATMAATRFSRNIVDSRIRSAFSGVATMQMAEVATDGDGADDVVSSSGGPVMWAKGYGSWSKLDSSAGVTGLQSISGGFVAGADKEIADAWRAGIFAGYGYTHTQAKGMTSKSEADTYQIGVYGGRQFGALGLRLGTSYSWNDVSAERSVTAAGLPSDLSADYSAHTGQGFVELGYLMQLRNTKFEPFVNQAVVYQNTESFSESGGAAALAVDSSDQTQGITTLGVRVEQDLSAFFKGPFALTGSLAWQHTFGDVDPETTMRFVAGGNSFNVTGVGARPRSGGILGWDPGAAGEECPVRPFLRRHARQRQPVARCGSDRICPLLTLFHANRVEPIRFAWRPPAGPVAGSCPGQWRGLSRGFAAGRLESRCPESGCRQDGDRTESGRGAAPGLVLHKAQDAARNVADMSL